MTKIFWVIAILAAALLGYFVFTPAFAGELNINPVIAAGPISIRWYGLALALGILAAYLIIRKNSWRVGISPKDADDYSFWAVVVSVLGARAYYVLFSLDYFLQNPGEIYQIWHGGISIYGGVIAGIIFTYLYCRKKVYTFWQMTDLVVLGLPVGQAIGRLGNFFNQEAFGVPTDLPWKMYIRPEHRPVQFAHEEFFHPAFLYEALACLVIFGILLRWRGKLRPGNLFLLYIFLYSLARFFIEGLRVDSFFASGFRVDQLAAFGLILISGIWFFKRQK